ncbi:hypothetical protein PENARI_c002G09214 [Penicillium arizonense]|uniref:BRCT domain-containing protein n=1 Tax=Penicillium arizonense TaxID=1835702 RepID=A0A1F5LV84_PENAI|nr:hypothetical protein PENARI_c002G09214 [Penicillium arizonense]OGE57072.1 hypothetical protein PENARI_c002G09214 [Penicillium arizonense]
MESQEDSIDFAKLRRDALGLHSPSQLCHSGFADTGNEPRNKLSYIYQVNSATGTFSRQPQPPKTPSDPARFSITNQHSPTRSRQHESQPMSFQKSDAGPEAVPGSQFDMSSGDGAPGDTQVVSQSVYDSLIRQNEESMHHDFTQTGADGATLRTLHEGDSGHIDLFAELDTARHGIELTQYNDENDDASNSDPNESSPMAYARDLFPESQRFLAETPGTGVKRAEANGVTTETPSVSRNPLAGDIESSGGLMGLSQVFRATQAPSSPLVNLQSELASDRPSPNIPIQQARVTHGISSPLMSVQNNFVRESSEPNLNYISMKESQTKRDRTLGERLTRSAGNIQSDQSDKEFYKESSFVERARRQREIDQETAAQLAGLRAPARSTSNLSARPTSPQHSPQDVEMVEPVASEEETEQEEDSVVQVPQSQEPPPSSTEEDKENYDGPPLDAAAAASAHERLSQALAFGLMHSPSATCLDAEPEDDIHRPRSFRSQTGNQPNFRSSQMQVNDSQPSPQPTPQASPISIYDEPVQNNMPQSPSRSHVNSPLPQRLQSSPPCSRPDQPSGASIRNGQQDSIVPNSQDIKSGKDTPFYRNGDAQSSAPSEQQNMGSSHPTEQGLGVNSSLQSHVTETPVHQRLKHIGDMARLTSIPETSPSNSQCHSESGSNGDGLNNEDDDLPPMFNGISNNRSSQIRPSGARALSSPLKRLLSSPGGGQRRALTEIAADLSPQVGTGGFDMGIGIFTNDDKEFRALVDGSPTRHKKKRRGNEGQSYIASDPIIPFTPRAQPPKSVTPLRALHSRPAPIPEEPEHVSQIQVPATDVRRQSKPPRRAPENVWEVENSPEQPFHRRSRIGQRLGQRAMSRSLRESQSPEKNTGKPERSAPKSKAVVHNPPPPPSSDPAGTRTDSADIAVSESTSTIASPTTPRPSQTLSDNTQIAPSQVLAVWRGQQLAYFPATCFGTPLGVSQNQFSVKFEDSHPVEVPKVTVKRFELRVGDEVKVDMPNVPKVTHVVRGLEDKLTKEELSKAVDDGLHPITDIYGHATVILGPKQRKSLPRGGLTSTENTIKVPIGRIYLDTMLWKKLEDREFTHRPEPVRQENKAVTPSEPLSVPVSPSARFSRSIRQASGIFAGMAFAVSYKEDETSKNRVTKLIEENGGTLLHEGFTQLFEASSIIPNDTPTKPPAKDEAKNQGLRLTSLAEDVGFACLIADTHSRREKYMQALALNLPCLSGRWVEDCLAQGRVLDWDIYLLPAGDSTYLNGATKSRLMIPTPPSSARLSETISARPKLLKGQSVLLVMGRGKAEEKRKAYIFLTYALGASRVERVPDLGTARALIDSQSDAGVPSSWDWIYVDDADQRAAQWMLEPKTQKIHLTHGRKRKKSTVIIPSTPIPSERKTTPKVVGNEFLCQSLILGRLFAE